MRKIVLTFGLIAGALLSAMMLMTLPFMDRIGFDKGMVIGYTTMVLAFLMVYFGVRSYRDNVVDGQLGFWRAFLVGLLITLVATCCYVATWEFIYFYLTPDFADKYAAYAIEQLRKSGASEAQLAAQVKEMEAFKVMYRQPLVNIAFTFLEPLPIGLLFTTVTAWLMSRRRGPAVAATA
jgi:Protein of unknown function (DUF4199)